MSVLNVEEKKKAIYNLHKIKPFDDEMTFFYDESGNCRKFTLNGSGFNSADALKGDFVLAGVAHEGKKFDINVSKLYEALDYKEGQKELKFKHLYHNSNDFLSFIGNKRVTSFLNWLNNSGLYLHYSTLNNLFYSLVDIVDSLWEENSEYINYISEIKSALYDFAIKYQKEFVDILIEYNYPDIKKTIEFCDKLCDLIKKYNYDYIHYPGLFLELFRKMLKKSGNSGELVFIQDNDPFILIEEYYLLYLERCEMFSKSIHIFDEEPNVKKKLSNIQLFENGNQINNWRFVESHTNIFVQVSDLIAGLLRNLFMFLDNNSMEQMFSIAIKLKENQIENFTIIYLLINKSQIKSQLFIKDINSIKILEERMIKLKILGILNKNIRNIGWYGINY